MPPLPGGLATLAVGTFATQVRTAESGKVPMDRPERAISGFTDAVVGWFHQNFGKIILLIIVAACATLISRIVAAAMRRTL